MLLINIYQNKEIKNMVNYVQNVNNFIMIKELKQINCENHIHLIKVNKHDFNRSQIRQYTFIHILEYRKQ